MVDIVVDVSCGEVVVVVVPPVPTACLLLGMIPPGISSASICANPRKRESMTATGGVMCQLGRSLERL